MPVLIEQVLLDDQRVLKPNGRVTVMPDKHRLEIRYAGLDLASPESVQYRYRIEGYQDEWVDVGNRHTAYLQRVPPGSYRFQVIAANRHGVWNEAGAALAIVVLPHWWGTLVVPLRNSGRLARCVVGVGVSPGPARQAACARSRPSPRGVFPRTDRGPGIRAGTPRGRTP
ncbi:MAG: hypothetical protein H7A46_11355 [Verrucomicrobiales bacterium]|nr:hypothetical protein [Verrucomicrobiales bacterium]